MCGFSGSEFREPFVGGADIIMIVSIIINILAILLSTAERGHEITFRIIGGRNKTYNPQLSRVGTLLSSRAGTTNKQRDEKIRLATCRTNRKCRFILLRVCMDGRWRQESPASERIREGLPRELIALQSRFSSSSSSSSVLVN